MEVKPKKEKRKKYIRTAAGETWEDPTLQEWDPGKVVVAFCPPNPFLIEHCRNAQ